MGTGTSLALSSLLSLLLFAGMQMYSRQLASTEWLTIQGGLLGSGLFVFSLTVSFCAARVVGAGGAARSLGLPLTPSTRPSIIWRIWFLAKGSKQRSSLRVSEDGGQALQPSALAAPSTVRSGQGPRRSVKVAQKGTGFLRPRGGGAGLGCTSRSSEALEREA